MYSGMANNNSDYTAVTFTGPMVRPLFRDAP